MNDKLADILFELSVLYSLTGERFKPQAFERAAEAVANLPEDVRTIYKRDGTEGLEAIPGVGAGIAERIEEFLTKRNIAEHVRMKKRLPVKISELVEIEGIGPKKLLRLYDSLKITSRAKLERAAKAGKLAKVKGLGPVFQDQILRAIGYLKESGQRALLGDIEPFAYVIRDRIASWAEVQQVAVGGSVRRMQETIGDLDLIVATDDPEETLRRFVTMPDVRAVHSHGEQKASVRLRNGRDGDLTVLPEDGWGASLIAWTGNKAHNVHLRSIAKKKRMLLDDYGLFRGTHKVAGETEEEVYEALGMQWIPPELRTDTGEIEAARKGALPHLAGYGDLKGDLQVQTDWTDGNHSVAEMAKAAQEAGLEYLAITDHTKALAMTGGLDESKLRRQMAEIDKVQRKFPKVKILKGSECDILKDGRLDIDDAVLAELDVVGVSVHSHFHLPRKAQTERIIRAMENEHADILFHPTARRINQRPPVELDINAVFEAAVRTRTVMEINASPERLDLNGEHVRMGVEHGVRFAISSDTHDREGFAALRYGIGQARRGWAEKHDIVNTRSWRQMLKMLK